MTLEQVIIEVFTKYEMDDHAQIACGKVVQDIAARIRREFCVHEHRYIEWKTGNYSCECCDKEKQEDGKQ